MEETKTETNEEVKKEAKAEANAEAKKEMDQKILSKQELDQLEDMEWYEANEKRNDQLMNLFCDDLLLSGLKTKTITNHMSNVYSFLDMLARREGYSMEEAIESVDTYLGDWFIRRCMWSTPYNIKTTAASIKKFAKTMEKKGFIDAKTVADLNWLIKEEMDTWQRRCARYNDPDIDMDDYEDFFDYFYGDH